MSKKQKNTNQQMSEITKKVQTQETQTSTKQTSGTGIAEIDELLEKANGQSNSQDTTDNTKKDGKKQTVDKNGIPDYEDLFRDGSQKEKKDKSSAIPKLLLKQNSGKLFVSAILYVIKASPTWAIPLVTSEVINIITAGGDGVMRKLFIYGAVLFFLLIQNIPTHMLYSRFVDKMLRTVSAGLRNTLIRKLQHLSLTYHKEIESGRVQSKFLRDIEAIEFLNTHITKSVIPNIISVIVSIVIAATKSGTVTAFFAVIIPINVFVVYLFRNSMHDTNKKFRSETENISAKVSNMLDMIPVTKAHGLENEEIAVLEERIRTLREKGLLLDKVNAYFGSVTWVVSQMMSAVCLFFTAYLTYKGKIQVGDVVLYQSYFNSISSELQGLINIYPQLTKGLDSIRSVSEIVLSNDVENNEGKIRLRYVHGTINFDDVSYRYPNGDEDMIKNFNLSVEPGECVAFVGSSGSGKSTIMNMIIGFMAPTKGTLSIDGKPIETLNLSDYRHFISVVPQTSILFTGTIRENITYGLENVSDELLNEVVHLANIDEFTDELPLGLDTPVTEGGGNLSGGQKQRISIARALIRDPKILILDEATSALDNISEYQVQKAINHLTKGRTTFIVAHRLSTIRNADRIVVMDNGRCVEMGTFDELMEKRGKFYELKTLNDMTANAVSEIGID